MYWKVVSLLTKPKRPHIVYAVLILFICSLVVWQAAADPQNDRIYIVERGDNLSKIATRLGTTVDALLRVNQLANPNFIQIGQQLIIPLAVPYPQPEDEPPIVETATPAAAATYVVQRGDTLSRIAQRFGLSVAELARRNNIRNLNVIMPGTTLLIGDAPIADAPLSPPSAATPVPTQSPAPSPPVVSNPSDGAETTYIVRVGDSFYKIARAHGVTIDALAIYNDLSLRTGLRAGMTLRIPPSSFVPPPLNEPREGELFIWPVNSRSIVQYARYGHVAIDIALPIGTPVQATAAGMVEFSGWHSGGYGYLVVVNHNNGWRSVYAHNSSLLVTVGQTVAQGEVLAESGNTGRSSMPHLHLEFSHNKVTKNPCDVLPVGC